MNGPGPAGGGPRSSGTDPVDGPDGPLFGARRVELVPLPPVSGAPPGPTAPGPAGPDGQVVIDLRGTVPDERDPPPAPGHGAPVDPALPTGGPIPTTMAPTMPPTMPTALPPTMAPTMPTALPPGAPPATGGAPATGPSRLDDPRRPSVTSGAAVPLSGRVLVPALGATGLAWLGAASAVVAQWQAGGWSGAAVLVPTLAGSAALAAVAARRARRELDVPVDLLRRAAVAWNDGDLSVRAELHGSSALVDLGRRLDATAVTYEGRLRRLNEQAEWGTRSRMVFEALDLADSEGDVHGVVGRALSELGPDRSVELLLSPPGSRELLRVAANGSASLPGCPVAAAGDCVAMRRGQAVVFDSSEAINACPRLRGRPSGRLSACCLPVTVSGRPVGVLHATAPERRPPTEALTGQLATLAIQVGNRLGALRALASSRREAATDGLTGLPNRRMLEAELDSLVDRGVPFVVVMADLDGFKGINDAHGHEVGDRALQLVAAVLRDNVRGDDLVARLGGEEFVLLYPHMSVSTSVEAIERIREALADGLDRARLPVFTCSFGITHSTATATAGGLLRVADAGLLRAKELGGDQVVYADESLAEQMFGA